MPARAVYALAALGACFAQEATAPASALYLETFQCDGGSPLCSFVTSTAHAEQDALVAVPYMNPGLKGDRGLVLRTSHRHYAVGAPLPSGVTIGDKQEFVLQYEVRLQEGLTCGGAYMKLLNATEGLDIATAGASSPYVIMFGPDRCGSTDKVHFIIRFRNPVTGAVEEKHCNKPPRVPSDRYSHLYTLVIRPDNTYSIKLDNVESAGGSLLTDFTPSILPPKEIDDVTDVKPADWVDEPKMKDPNAVKPEDWDESAPEMIEDADAKRPAGWLPDEPLHIADPNAVQPEDWDVEEDGDWEAPTVENPKCAAAPGCGEWVRPKKKNPAYRGKWRAPMIDNPAYKGVWKPRQVANPGYFNDEHVHMLSGATMGAAFVEIWTTNGGILFDNVYLGTSEADASTFAAATWKVKHDAQEANDTSTKREDERRKRADAAAAGGFFEQVALYAGDLQDVAVANPVVTVITAVVIIVSTLVGCFCMCGGFDADLPPVKPRQQQGAVYAEDSDADLPDPHVPTGSRGGARRAQPVAAEEEEEEEAPEGKEQPEDGDDAVEGDAAPEEAAAEEASTEAVEAEVASPAPAADDAAATTGPGGARRRKQRGGRE